MKSTTLLIDAGNSFAKLAVCDDASVARLFANNFEVSNSDKGQWLRLSEPIANALIDEKKIYETISSFAFDGVNVSKVVISSVRSKTFNEQLSLWLQAILDNAEVIFLRPQKHTAKVANLYQTIDTLGIDRWLSALAAFTIVEKQLVDKILPTDKNAIVVIGAGTALTIDMVQIFCDASGAISGNYNGGMIIPGAQKMLQSLTTTDNLPAVASGLIHKTADVEKVFAKTTHEAIASGVSAAMVGAILYARAELLAAGYTIVQTLYCGGAALPLFMADNVKRKQCRHDLQFLGMIVATQK